MMNRFNTYYRMMIDDIYSSIKDGEIRDFALNLLKSVPDYFFIIPASSSGKYHPINDLGDGGLVRHSITVRMILDELLVLNEYDDITERERDLLRLAALFHDTFKSGTQSEYEENNHTKFNHPICSASNIMVQSVNSVFPWKDAQYISDVIATHMGQWNAGPGHLPLPETKGQKLLHLADYLASRKIINVDVTKCDDENKKGE